jgi:glycosyltransferase involved in cell wall biosynthesis
VNASLPSVVQVIERPLSRLPRQLQKLWWEQVTVPQTATAVGAQVLWVPYWAAPWWQPVKTVVTVHDLIPMLLPENRGGWLNRAYTRLVARTARKSAKMIAVSHASKRDIVAHLRVSEEKVHVVWHGPNLESAAAPTSEQLSAIRQKYNLPDRYFLYLGGFEARKNLTGILQGYASYLRQGGSPAVKMVIAGQLPRVDSAFTPDPRRIAQELGITSQVLFAGFVDEQDKPAVYAAATAFLFPSKYEGFGMMVLEAMQFGAPVISSSQEKVA